VALFALEDVIGKQVVAFFALVPATTIIPPPVGALMILKQILHLALSHLLSCLCRQVRRPGITIDNHVGTSNQSLFLEVGAFTRLPFGSALVAKLGSAFASWTHKERRNSKSAAARGPTGRLQG
jgi:hypothetical protein